MIFLAQSNKRLVCFTSCVRRTKTCFVWFNNEVNRTNRIKYFRFNVSQSREGIKYVKNLI